MWKRQWKDSCVYLIYTQGRESAPHWRKILSSYPLHFVQLCRNFTTIWAIKCEVSKRLHLLSVILCYEDFGYSLTSNYVTFSYLSFFFSASISFQADNAVAIEHSSDLWYCMWFYECLCRIWFSLLLYD